MSRSTATFHSILVKPTDLGLLNTKIKELEVSNVKKLIKNNKDESELLHYFQQLIFNKQIAGPAPQNPSLLRHWQVATSTGNI